MNREIFREKSLERVESPEQLNDYIRVASPGVWLARRQQLDLSMDGAVRSETVRLDNLSATAPIPDAMFDAGSFFPGVTFTDSFEKMF